MMMIFNPDNVVSRAPAMPKTPERSPQPSQSPLQSIAENREIIRTHQPPFGLTSEAAVDFTVVQPGECEHGEHAFEQGE